MKSSRLLVSILTPLILSACITGPSGSIFGRGGDEEDQGESTGGMQVPPDMPSTADTGNMSAVDMSGDPPRDMSTSRDMGETRDMAAANNTTACQDTCTAGSFDCQGPRLYACEQDANTGCMDFAEIAQCGQDQFCDSNAGECACQVDEACTPGERRCDGRDAVEVCVRSESGCTTWEVEDTCDGRSYCQNSRCICPSTDCTAEGATSCNGPSVVVCERDAASGCLYADTTQSTRCGATEYCEGGACQTCEEQCTPGTTVCTADGEIRNCIKTSSDKCPRLSSPLGCQNSTNSCVARPGCAQQSDCATCGMKNGSVCYYCAQ